jgi:hypothetical protein
LSHFPVGEGFLLSRRSISKSPSVFPADCKRNINDWEWGQIDAFAFQSYAILSVWSQIFSRKFHFFSIQSPWNTNNCFEPLELGMNSRSFGETTPVLSGLAVLPPKLFPI